MLRGLKFGVVDRPTYSVSFIMSPSTAAVSHTDHPSAGTSRDDCRALGRHKGDILQIIIIIIIRAGIAQSV